MKSTYTGSPVGEKEITCGTTRSETFTWATAGAAPAAARSSNAADGRKQRDENVLSRVGNIFMTKITFLFRANTGGLHVCGR